jgi:hypothetical protein
MTFLILADGRGMDSSGSGEVQVAGLCEQGRKF